MPASARLDLTAQSSPTMRNLSAQEDRPPQQADALVLGLVSSRAPLILVSDFQPHFGELCDVYRGG